MKIKEKTYYTFKDKETLLNFLKQAKKEGQCWAHNVCPVTDMANCYGREIGAVLAPKAIERYNDDSLWWIWDMNPDYPVVEWKPFDQHIEIYFDDNMIWGNGIDDMADAHEVCNKLHKLPNVNNLKSIIVEDGVTTITTKDGKTAQSKCNPEDEFDITDGVKVAIKHLNEFKLSDAQQLILEGIQKLGGVWLQYDYFNDEWDATGVVEVDNHVNKDIILLHFDAVVFKGLEKSKLYYIPDLLSRSSNR